MKISLEMSKTELAWLAGLLEGEGCFYLTSNRQTKKTYHYPAVQLCMTDRDIVERAAVLMGTKCWARKANYKPNWNQAWVTAVIGSRAVALMEAVLPFMGIRRSAKIRSLIDQKLD